MSDHVAAQMDTVGSLSTDSDTHEHIERLFLFQISCRLSGGGNEGQFSKSAVARTESLPAIANRVPYVLYKGLYDRFLFENEKPGTTVAWGFWPRTGSAAIRDFEGSVGGSFQRLGRNF